MIDYDNMSDEDMKSYFEDMQADEELAIRQSEILSDDIIY